MSKLAKETFEFASKGLVQIKPSFKQYSTTSNAKDGTSRGRRLKLQNRLNNIPTIKLNNVNLGPC